MSDCRYCGGRGCPMCLRPELSGQVHPSAERAQKKAQDQALEMEAGVFIIRKYGRQGFNGEVILLPRTKDELLRVVMDVIRYARETAPDLTEETITETPDRTRFELLELE
jgi:hypothetical protein